MLLYFLYKHKENIFRKVFLLTCLVGVTTAYVNNQSIRNGNLPLFLILSLFIGIAAIAAALCVDRLIATLVNIQGFFLRTGVRRTFSGKQVRYWIGNKYVIEKAIRKLTTNNSFYGLEEKIQYVCNRHTEGILFVMEAPARHHNVISLAYEFCANKDSNHEQGFVTTLGQFVNRQTAKKIAIAADQLLPGASNSKDLFSECVWTS